MKTRVISAALSAALILISASVTSCSGEKTSNNDTNSANSAQSGNQATDADNDALNSALAGQWRLTDYAGDGLIGEMTDDQNYILTFNPDDYSFSLSTDCNTIGGQYSIDDHSITFTNTYATQMACEDETVENAMKIIIPMITGYSISDNSRLSLRSDGRIMARFTRLN